jgi:acyl-CoA dehydrogenase
MAAEASMGATPLSEALPRFLANDGERRLSALGRLRSQLRKFGEHEVRPRALEIDRRAEADAGHFDWELVGAGAREGLLGLCVPKEAGGRGALALETSIAMEELCAACPGVANIFGAHALGIAPLLILGGPAHWEGVLREIADAERRGAPILMAAALTEPDAGTDVQDPDLMRLARVTSHARRVSGGYRLSGTKRFISNGSVARWISVFMPTDPRRVAETCTGFVVDAEAGGLTVTRVEHKMGQRACPAAELHFDDVFVPDELMLGREGDGRPGTMMVLALSRPPVGAIATGIARGAYERVHAWLRSEAKGLLERQEVQLALAEMEEEIHLARQAYVDASTELELAGIGRALERPFARAAGLVPRSVRRRARVRRWASSGSARELTAALLRNSTSAREATRSVALSSLAKARGADVAVRVTGRALEISGLGAGPVRPELEKLWRDAKLTQIYEGTNQLNRLQAYRGLCLRETMPGMLPEARGDRPAPSLNGSAR